MKHPICPNGHTPELFFVPIMYFNEETEQFEQAEYSVMIDADGNPTNFFNDGTVGVSAEDKAFAQGSDTAYCPDCLAEVNWK